MGRRRKNMDNIRSIVGALTDWISLHPAPPVCWAAYQKVRSFNNPSSYAGFFYQTEEVCSDWEIGDQRHPFPAGHVVLVSTHLGSHSAPLRGEGLWFCTFDLREWEGYPHFLKHWKWDPRRVRTPLQLIQAYREVAFYFSLHPKGKGFLLLKAAVLRFLALVLEELDPPSARTTPSNENIRRAIEFLYAHYSSPELSLSDVAAAAGLSAHHFGRVFLEQMNLSPMKYLRSLRIAQSQSLLLNTNLRINEIAREVGYTDSLHFSRVFRQTTGRSPRQLRESVIFRGQDSGIIPSQP